MLQEMELNKALKKFASGRKVMAMMPDPDMEGRYQVVPVELLFNDVRLLVDVPAVVNPDFEEAVQGMTNPPPVKPEAKPVKKPRAKKEPANKKINDEEAARLLAEGKTQKEMAKAFGVTPSTMSIWVKNYWLTKDGRKCATCKYRDTVKGRGNCNYTSIVGHSRGCSAENCTRYEKGEPEKKIKAKMVEEVLP